jgi:hypothetical protein
MLAPMVHLARLLPVLALLAPLTVGTTHAQEPSEDLDIEVIGQPVFHGAGDDLGLRLSISNGGETDLEGFAVQVGAGGKVTTRSQLHAIFDQGDADTIGQLAVPFDDRVLPAGSSTRVRIEEPVAGLQGISLSGQEGVYPLEVVLTDESGGPLATTVTTVLYYPNRPDTRLKIVPVLPLQDRPARDPSGAFAPDAAGDFPLEDALDGGGWLAGYMDALDSLSAANLNLGLAPTPRLLEEIADMADGYERRVGEGSEMVAPSADEARAADSWLGQLRVVSSRSSVQPLLVPYSFPDLPAIAGAPDAIGTQLRAGGSGVLKTVLGAAAASEAGRWLMPPGGRVDEATYDQIPVGVEHVLFAPDALADLPTPELSGCPEAQYSFTCPVRVQTPVSGATTGLVFDESIQQRLELLLRPGHTRGEIQQFFAETAMIREEQPGRSDRIIAVTLPASWQPDPGTARTLLGGLARAPWLETLTPEAGLEGGPPERRRTVVGDVGDIAGQPDAQYFEEIGAVAATVEQYRSMSPPEEVVERLTRNVLVAQSRAWWPEAEEGLDFAHLTRDEVEGELGKIRLTGPQEITLTSKTGQIQFVVLNETGYEVDVNVLVTSLGVTENLTLRGEGLSREDIVAPQHLASEQQRITFDVTTRASGIFPLEVRLETPDGLDVGEPVPLTVRSTEFNEIALGLTFGALAFLILFYVVRALRRRRSDGPQEVEARGA